MNGETVDGSSKVVDVVPVEKSSAISAIETARIDQQIVTAKKFPRKVDKAKENAVAMATMDLATAGQCFYSLKRTGKDGVKFITGPSIRALEIVSTCWGNIHCGARPLGDDGEFIRAEGAAWDLENNVRQTTEVTRRITDRNGRRYSADMIAVTANAACAIAKRNALLGVIPRAVTNAVCSAAIKTMEKGAGTVKEKWERTLAAFDALGVKEPQLLAYVGKSSVSGLTHEDIRALAGAYTAINEKETTVDAEFGAGAAVEMPTRTKKGKGKGKGKGKKKTKQEEPEPEPEAPAEDANAQTHEEMLEELAWLNESIPRGPRTRALQAMGMDGDVDLQGLSEEQATELLALFRAAQ